MQTKSRFQFHCRRRYRPPAEDPRKTERERLSYANEIMKHTDSYDVFLVNWAESVLAENKVTEPQKQLEFA